MTTFNNSGSKRQELLQLRQKFLQTNSEVFKGNTRERISYLKKLDELKPNLTPFQKEYLIGLILSDATVDLDHEKKTARVKIQQSAAHEGWLESVRKIFLEYMPNDKPFSPPSASRLTMRETQTFKCKAFYDFLKPIFYQNQQRKSIDQNQIATFISPVCVAAWFCGDGSKGDHTREEGKSLTFHSQGFTQAENEALADILKSNLGLNCHAKKDGNVSGKWRLDVSGPSYETFVTKVGPYLDEVFYYRVPSGRAVGSPYGDMTAAKKDNILGSAFKSTGIDELVENYKNSN